MFIGYLLDTNVVSEAARPRPHPSVLMFLEAATASQTLVCISVLTLGELQKGVTARRTREPMAPSGWQNGLKKRNATLRENVLPIDCAVARIWGELSAGRSLPVVDTLIAATALVHGLAVVTRNVRDIASAGVDVVNPWAAG